MFFNCVVIALLLCITGVSYSQSQSAISQNAIDYGKRGAEKSASGDYAGAIADYSKAIQLGPLDPLDPNVVAKAYTLRGVTKGTLGDTTEACIDLRKAQDLGNANASELVVKYCQ